MHSAMLRFRSVHPFPLSSASADRTNHQEPKTRLTKQTVQVQRAPMLHRTQSLSELSEIVSGLCLDCVWIVSGLCLEVFF